MAVPRLNAQHSAILAVDMQEKLLPHIHNAQSLVQQTAKLLKAARLLQVPLLATQQYPEGLGPTVAPLAELLTHAVCKHEKLKFSACTGPVRDALVHHGVRCVVVCGIEAHVCVLQTCLDLADHGYVTAMAVDAVGSRHLADQEAAVMRSVQAGIVPTTVESAILEWVHEAGGDRFKAILPLIK